MSIPIVLLILGSSLAWSLFDMSRKRLTSSLSAKAAVVWLMLLQTPLFLALSFGETWSVPTSSYWWPAIASIVVNLLGNLWFIQAVRLAPFSLAVPMLSLTPVFSSLGAFVLLGEPLEPRQIAGLAVVIGGTLFLGSKSVEREEVEASGARTRLGLMLMVGVAALFAAAPVLDKFCLRSIEPGQHAFLQCLGIAAGLAAFLKFRGHSLERGPAWQNRKWLVLAVIFAAIALGTQLASIRLVSVGIFDALKRSFGLVAALGVGFVVFKEPVTKVKVVTLVAIAVGIVLLLA